VPPVLCDYCESSSHDVHTCPFRAHVATKCASVEKTINEMTDKMLETMKLRIVKYSQCFTQSGENYSEPNSSLGFPKHEVSRYDDFAPLILLGLT